MKNQLIKWSRIFGVAFVAVLIVHSNVFAAKQASTNFTFLGQELGVSDYASGKTGLAKKGRVTDVSLDDTDKVLKVEGRLIKKTPSTAVFSYGTDGRLERITVTAPAVSANRLFSEIAQGLKIVDGQKHVLEKGNGIAKISAQGKSAEIEFVIKDWEGRRVQNAYLQSDTQYRSVVAWLIVGGTSLITIAVLLFSAGLKAPQWLKKYQLSIADNVVSAATCAIAYYLAYGPGVSAFMNSYIAAAALGSWRILTWAIGATRSGGWMPGKKPWHSLLALPAIPLLLLPTVARNSIKSPQYCGLVLLWLEITAALHIILSMPIERVVYLIPFIGIFSAGIVRLYAATYDRVHKTPIGRNPWIAAITSGICWPITLLVVAIILPLYLFLSAFAAWPVVLFGAFVGLFFDSALGGALLALCLVGFPVILGVFSGALIPTGVGCISDPDSFDSGVGGGDFSFANSSFSFETGFDFNSANGLPMIGGMGGFDINGNPFGSSFNDPF